MCCCGERRKLHHLTVFRCRKLFGSEVVVLARLSNPKRTLDGISSRERQDGTDELAHDYLQDGVH